MRAKIQVYKNVSLDRGIHFFYIQTKSRPISIQPATRYVFLLTVTRRATEGSRRTAGRTAIVASGNVASTTASMGPTAHDVKERTENTTATAALTGSSRVPGLAAGAAGTRRTARRSWFGRMMFRLRNELMSKIRWGKGSIRGLRNNGA